MASADELSEVRAELEAATATIEDEQDAHTETLDLLNRERVRVGDLEKANEMLEEDRKREKARADATIGERDMFRLCVQNEKENAAKEREGRDAEWRAVVKADREALAAARREVRLYQLFVLSARWLLAGLQRDVEASEPAVLLYTPLRMAALRVLGAFQPPGTVRSFAGPESAALSELADAARAHEMVSNKPIGGESGEWWQAALRSLELPSVPWGREMERLRAALAAPAAGEEP